MSENNLPRVTQILKAAGLVDATWFNDLSRELGSAVHKAAQYLDEEDIDWKSLDLIVVPRVRQYQCFLEEVRPRILAIEEEVVNEPLRYAGRLDRRVVINGREGVLDLKGPTRASWHGLQLAMYAACFPRPMARWSLYLEDERYQLVEHRDPLDWTVAKAAISIAAWKENHEH